MARKPMSQAQRDAFRDRMAAARAARGGGAAPRKDKTVARRGRRAKQKEANPMTDAEMVLRQQEAAALLGGSATTGKRRRRGRKPGRRGGGIVAFILGGGNRSAGKTSTRKGKGKRMARRGNKGNGQAKSYKQVVGSLPIQVSIEVAEGLFSLGSVAVDILAASTKTTADDFAFPVVQRVLTSAARFASQRYLVKYSPELAAVVAHGFSAMNGDRNGNYLRNGLRRYLQPATP